MIVRQPESACTDTLFPYTALFLSGRGQRGACLELGDALARTIGRDRWYRFWLCKACGNHSASFSPLLQGRGWGWGGRSEEHTSELQSLMRISYAVFCLKKKNQPQQNTIHHQ